MISSHAFAHVGVRFLIGQNRLGQWVARDEDGRRGGVFASRAAAIHFAWQETAGDAGAITPVRALELFPRR